MGCSSPQNATIPHNIPAGHYNRLLQVSQISHPLNVNKKYEHLCRLREGQMIGHGFKKTCAFDCVTTPEELKLKRKQYWQTRVNGSPQCWNAIRAAIDEPNLQTGKLILQSARITMLTGSIQMNVDVRCNKYEVPVFCINEPSSYSLQTMAEKNLNHDYNDATLKVKVRSVMFPSEDVILELSLSTTVAEIKVALSEKKSLGDKGIRLFYGGREISDSRTLGNYNYKQNMIVQAMIR